jgi:uncharacterized protein YecE (DUF72 family)
MGTILIGTCGYDYKEWTGPVYPEGTKDKDRLPFYSKLFSTVEIDNTYYGMPTAQSMAKKLMDGGPALTFAIKAYRSLTHDINPATWDVDAKTYREAIDPIMKAGRLEGILFQFPYCFHYTVENRWYLDKVLSYFSDVRPVVEFRNADWSNSRVIEALRGRNIPLASLDMPDLTGLPPQTDVVTGPLAYIRLHGRNEKAWWGSDKAAQYNYLYSDVQLESMVDRVQRIAGLVDRVLVYFNNHPNGFAVANAQTLAGMLRKLGLLTETKD